MSARITKDTIEVTKEEIEQAYREIDPELLKVIRDAIKNIRDYHMLQKRSSWFDTKDGIFLGQRILPIAKVGVYVPGGKAVLSSSVLMNVIPAKVAGVNEIIMVTPPQKSGGLNPTSVVAAVEAGVDRIFERTERKAFRRLIRLSDPEISMWRLPRKPYTVRLALIRLRAPVRS